ncbi:hybrid sensor histidine kinase/response regulator transcription factor [Pedobacter cryotolerans]|uniref:histidine kinase n=1 Tax=Pedobacter cryotolerans TaxID=2571270 RepID=A0A4U1BWD8_9SPHI|nr:hybrid sensor histidine kinase/response regulator transcription factor [Pedobacter cryotolerans]TKB96606.1 response regulator [Pedobacter cryotolerans]
MFKQLPFISRILILFTLAFNCEVAFAQDDYKFITLNTKNGLSSNTVNAVIQDKSGMMWFGTNDGLNKFDGTNFTSYTHSDSDSSSIPSNNVNALLLDRTGTLWVGTSSGGLAHYNANQNKFVSFVGDGGLGAKTQLNVKALYLDLKGNIWVGTFGGYRIIDAKTKNVQNIDINRLVGSGSTVLCFYQDHPDRMWIGTNMGLLRYDLKSNQTSKFLHQPSNPKSLSDNCIRTVARNKSGRLFFGTNKGLNILVDNNNFLRISRSTGSQSSNDIIYAASFARDGKLWLGTEDGISIFDPNIQTFVNVKTDKRKSFSLSHKSVRSICMAKNAIIWFGTFQGGVNKLDPNLALFNLKTSTLFDPKGLASPVVTSFAEYKKGEIFVGTDGGGLHLFNKGSGLFEQIKIRNDAGFSENPLSIMALELDLDGNLWVGTYQNGLFIYDPDKKTYKQIKAEGKNDGLSQNDIFFIKQDSKGLIWIGTNGSGVNVYNPISDNFSRYWDRGQGNYRMPSNGFMRAIAEDQIGNIWLASNGTGIVKFNRNKQTFKVYNKENSGLGDDVVLSLLQDSKNNLWAGTNGGGLSLFNQSSHKFSNIDETNGLANSIVYKILEGQDGLIWVSTDKGLSCINPLTKKIKNYGRPNGIQDGPFVLGAGISTSDGELFFGGQDGFNYFNPLKLPTNGVLAEVILTELKVANISIFPGKNSPITEQIEFADRINLDYGQNFSISYAGLNFTAPQQTKYAYRLVGLEKEWNFVGNEKTAYYTNLDPGDYIFEVRASNSEGVWNNKVTSISVHIQPPIWRTIYAYFFYVVVIASTLLGLRQRGIKRIKKELALKQEKINAEERLLQQRREGERAHALDTQKIKFLTNLSHEFRTPISLILAPIDKLLAIKQEQSVSNQVKMIRRNARRLLNLVNQLLDFRKMEEQELKLNLTKGDLIEFVKEASEAFQDLSDRRRISLHLSSENRSLITLFDQDKIERIVFNLLSNAFKFTQEGGKITIDMFTKGLDCQEKKLFCMYISDTGIGISEAYQQKVFDRFFMDTQVNSILNQGSGIGLSIVKEFVELHGGHIWLESKEGSGTTFYVEIPITLVDEHVSGSFQEPILPLLASEDHIIGAEDQYLDEVKMATVLLVEDNDEFRFHLKDSLQAYYHIIEANNGKEGWQKTLSAHPQLVVTDISMPEMDGIELSQKIKNDKRTSHIPVILLTAISGENDQIKGLKSGANDYLTKPFNFDILNAKISNLLIYNKSVKSAYTKHVKVKPIDLEIESSEVKLMNKIVQYIDEKLNDPKLSVEDLSKHVGMSRGSLYHKLLEITGLTPIEYIRSVKLDRAVELLEKSDFNVAQIAYMTGFGAPNYFSRLFKAKFNMLPSEFMNIKRREKKERS